MYVEEIKHKRKGKIYRTVLVRESYRNGKTVQHRTISNISRLPEKCIQQIKDALKGDNLQKISFENLAISESKEYGASKTIIEFAKEIRLGAFCKTR